MKRRRPESAPKINIAPTYVSGCQIPLIRYDRTHLVPLQSIAPIEEFQFDEEGDFENVRAQLLHECSRGGSGATGREQVIDQEHAGARLERVDMHGDGRRAVFQIVFLVVRFVRKLALFANGNEAGLEPNRGCRRKNKSARIDAHHRIHLPRLVAINQQIDATWKQLRVGQYRRDVLKLNPRFRKISNISNRALNVSRLGLNHA